MISSRQRFFQKNEQTNSILLLVDLISLFLEESEDIKKTF
jgi:hypothetical protein